jgi:hypothetical protein
MRGLLLLVVVVCLTQSVYGKLFSLSLSLRKRAKKKGFRCSRRDLKIRSQKHA